jgi:hypothetical protein
VKQRTNTACVRVRMLPPCRYRSYFANGTGISDNRATLVDYARITHSMPICHGCATLLRVRQQEHPTAARHARTAAAAAAAPPATVAAGCLTSRLMLHAAPASPGWRTPSPSASRPSRWPGR